MLPTQENIKELLVQKYTDKQIAQTYNLHFQKISALIQLYGINPNILRKTDKFIVYEHIHNCKIIYVGSGYWYRCRKYTNRRNSIHRQLMASGKVEYRIVGEYDTRDEARKVEIELIQKYKKIGQAFFNIQTR